MDDLIEIVHQLSTLEIAQLKRELKTDKQKIKLLEYLLVTDEINNQEIMEVLNYQNNKSAYYTFKHRLLQDIISFKFDSGKNAVVKLREDIDNIRSLLYSNQPKLLEKKLNDLTRRSEESELFGGAHEVALCKYLLHYHDPKRRLQYEEEIRSTARKSHLFNRLEFLFFESIFLTHDQFYLEEESCSTRLNEIVQEMEGIHKELQAAISFFMLESTALSVKLNHRSSTDPIDLERIRQLSLAYLKTPLKFYYPNCNPAIQCLLGKFHYNTGDFEAYETIIEEMSESLDDIKGFRPYEDVYFYYLHSVSDIYIRKRKYREMLEYMNEQITEMDVLGASNKISFYLLYLKGVVNFYGGQYSKAYSYLLKARNYTKYLEKNSRWVLVDASVFALMVLSREGNFQLMDSEKKYLKRQLKKTDANPELIAAFLDVLNAHSKNKKPAKVEEARQQFLNLQDQSGQLKLVQLDFFLERNLA